MNRQEALGAWIDLLLSTPEEKHITGNLDNHEYVDGEWVVVGWCAVGLTGLLDWSLFEVESAFDSEFEVVAWMLDCDTPLTDYIVSDNDDELLTFREIGEAIKTGKYQDMLAESYAD